MMAKDVQIDDRQAKRMGLGECWEDIHTLLYGLRIDIEPDCDEDGNPLQTAETIEVKRPNGDVLLQWHANSLLTFRWRSNLGEPIIGPYSIKVSKAAEIEINPPLERD